MTDERGRKRDTPNGVFSPSGTPAKNVGHAPRGAGLSGNLPGGSRFGGHGNSDATPGSVPISIQNEPRRARDPHDPASGPWEASGTPARRQPPEAPPPPMAAARSAPPPPHRPQTVRGVDGFAATRPAEVVGGGRGPSMDPPRGASNRAGPSPGPARPNERSASGSPTGGPPRALDPKTSLRLKLEGDTFYEANEGRVKVPKRRGPVFFGFLFVLTVLVIGAFLWIDDHGGIENFAVAVKRVIEGEPDPAVQTSLTYSETNNGQPGAAATAQQPGAQPGAAAALPGAQAPAQPTAAAPQQAAPPAQEKEKPAEQAAPQQTGQIATGEIEAPDQQPANDPGVKAEQPPAAKPKPKPVAAKPKPKPVVHRDPVLKVQPLGNVFNEAPPDPGGGPSLPPPDPPAPD